MSDAEDDSFRQYVIALNQKSTGYADLFKGVIGEDKHLEERDIARIVVGHLGFHEPIQFTSEPGGRDTPPDIAADLPNGARVAIEVTELVDGKVRGLHAQRAAAERRQGLTPLAAFRARDEAFQAARKAAQDAANSNLDADEAFNSTYRAEHPTPDHISPYVFANWDVERIASELSSILEAKDRKLGEPRGGPYSEIFLAIFTDEPVITRAMLSDAVSSITYSSKNISKAFVILYDSSAQSEVVVDII